MKLFLHTTHTSTILTHFMALIETQPVWTESRFPEKIIHN